AVPRDAMRSVERGIGARARKIMPWVLLLLYAAGIGMAWHHRAVLNHPLASSFGALLSLKILLALSVFGHFSTAMFWLRTSRMTAARSRYIHFSLFVHLVGIVLLAKLMFYWHW